MRKLDSPRIDYRSLWSAVVLQAIEDIETQPMQSLVFADAVAFFTRSGSWAESRSTIADFLDMHRDELEAIGRRCIDARRTREELPPEARRRSPDTPCVTSIKLARLVARRQTARSRTRLPAQQPGRTADRVIAKIRPHNESHLRL